MIGIFDSGLGGLTVLKPLRELLPRADITYFGDIRNAPYGNRSHEELTRLTVDAIRLLRAHGATGIVSACNSVSASLSLSLFDTLELGPGRLIEMVGPTVASLKGTDERLLLCATSATIRSQIYQSAFAMVGKDIATLALPDLAGAVERGAPQAELEAIVLSELMEINIDSIDAVILACTHYPLAVEAFRRVLPDHVRIINPGTVVAARVARAWEHEETGEGRMRLIISAESAPFRAMAKQAFPDEDYEIEVLEHAETA
ncbi:MAG TPA: aspartate/glutamate racemase family protein [Candidatus Paceibacterota bacterium]|jgi:glutamate racemase